MENLISKIDKEKAIAVFSNDLVEGYYENFNLYDLRILAFLASLVSPGDEEFKRYRVPVNVLHELMDVNVKLYQVVRKAILDLMDRKIVIRKNNRMIALAVLTLAEYKEGEGYFEIMLNEVLKPFLLKLKERFTIVPLKYSFSLSSIYAFRVYELVKQYEDTGYRKDSLIGLRKMLGIKDNEYSRFSNFEERVLKVAKEEINNKTDLSVSYRKQKVGRKVTHIIWDIKKKTREEIIDTMNKCIMDKKKAIWEYVDKNHVYLVYIYDNNISISDMENFNNAFRSRVKIIHRDDKEFVYVLCIDRQEADEFIEVFREPYKNGRFKHGIFNPNGLISKFSEWILETNNDFEFINTIYSYMKKRGLFKERVD